MSKKSSRDYIQHHKKYIDYRINRVRDYVSSAGCNVNTFASRTVNYLISDQPDNTLLCDIDEETLRDLSELRTMLLSWDILEHGDLAGYIYQEIQTKTRKKTKGQYFTPADIVNYITSRAMDLSCTGSTKILDPACGSGQFLIAFLRHLINQHGSTDQCMLEKIVKEQIYGLDTDPVAAGIARFNLSRISGCSPDSINVHTHDFLFSSEVEIRTSLGLSDSEGDTGFDLIMGNPPWGSTLSEIHKKHARKNYSSVKSGINTFTLFIERSFDFLRQNGLIAFLVPEAYLNIKAHSASRRLVLDRAAIMDLALWGEQFRGVFAPSTSVIIKEEPECSVREKNIVQIRPRNRAEKGTSVLVPQACYHATSDNIFTIQYSRRSVTVISAMENQDCFFLRDRARFYLGIVTGNNSIHISDTLSKETPDPIITGRDLSQYRIRFSGHYFRYSTDTLQQVAPRKYYLEPNKILYKFIGKGLTFALDTVGYYSLNNVNGFIPGPVSLNRETLLCLLNSRLMQYYYENNFFTIKVLRGNLERLPLKHISTSNQDRIAGLVKRMDNCEEPSSCREREEIEDIIFHEYGIRDRDACKISEHALSCC